MAQNAQCATSSFSDFALTCRPFCVCCATHPCAFECKSSYDIAAAPLSGIARNYAVFEWNTSTYSNRRRYFGIARWYCTVCIGVGKLREVVGKEIMKMGMPRRSINFMLWAMWTSNLNAYIKCRATILCNNRKHQNLIVILTWNCYWRYDVGHHSGCQWDVINATLKGWFQPFHVLTTAMPTTAKVNRTPPSQKNTIAYERVCVISLCPSIFFNFTHATQKCAPVRNL